VDDVSNPHHFDGGGGDDDNNNNNDDDNNKNGGGDGGDNNNDDDDYDDDNNNDDGDDDDDDDDNNNNNNNNGDDDDNNNGDDDDNNNNNGGGDGDDNNNNNSGGGDDDDDNNNNGDDDDDETGKPYLAIGVMLLLDKTVLNAVLSPASPFIRVAEKAAGSYESSVNIYLMPGRHIPRDSCLHIRLSSIHMHLRTDSAVSRLECYGVQFERMRYLKLPLYLIKHHSMKTCLEAETEFHTF
jgi:hypothetical protein